MYYLTTPKKDKILKSGFIGGLFPFLPSTYKGEQ